MNDSSSALRQPTLPSRLQTLSTSQFAINRRTHEILHTDVVLAGPNPQPLDERTRELRGQRVEWFVSFDTRARHSARIRPSAEVWSIRTPLLGTRDTGLLVCPARGQRLRLR